MPDQVKVKMTQAICACVVLVIAACVFGNIFSPTVSRTALQECARDRANSGSAFCMELARRASE